MIGTTLLTTGTGIETNPYFSPDGSQIAYDVNTNEVTKVLPNDGLDLKSACSGSGAIVYEQVGSLHLFDLASGASRPIDVRLAGDMPEVRPSFRKVETAGLSGNQLRAVFIYISGRSKLGPLGRPG